MQDAKFFQGLRTSVRQRFGEAVDFKEYERRVDKLLHRHIAVDEVEQIVDRVNIFDREALAAQLKHRSTESKMASQADEIAHKTKKSLAERIDEDPILFAKLSKLVEEAIEEYHQSRLSAAEYLERIRDLQTRVDGGGVDETPRALHGRPEARAFYNVLGEILKPVEDRKSQDHARLAEAALEIDEIVDTHKVVDWHRNPDVEKRMRDNVEDYLLFEVALIGDIADTEEQQKLDRILNEIMRIAKSQTV